jgi:hypothetical protein
MGMGERFALPVLERAVEPLLKTHAGTAADMAVDTAEERLDRALPTYPKAVLPPGSGA